VVSDVSGEPERGWEAVDSAPERLQERASARERTDARRRRLRAGAAWTLRVALPAAGAAAVLATLSEPVALLAAAALVPALLCGLTARRSVVEGVLWALIALAAEVVLVFAVGIGLLGFGPR
jgi:hypothetical protein